MKRLTTKTAAVTAFLLAVAAAVVWGAPSAGAWEIVKSTNGVILCPQTTDSTGTVQIVVDYSYKGGDVYGLTYEPGVYGSYNSHLTLTQLTYPGTVVISGIEVPLVDGYRVQRVTVNNTTTGKTDYCAIVLNESLNVAVTNEVTTTAVISGSPTITLDSTLTVDPWKTAGLPDQWQAYLATLGAVMGGGSIAAWVMRR